jgi:hypothetical protein
LGYSIVISVFPHQTEALTEAVLIFEIGVGYPISVLGLLLAAYFGSAHLGTRSRLAPSSSFFKSPVFFCPDTGDPVGIFSLAWRGKPVPGHPIFQAGGV